MQVRPNTLADALGRQIDDCAPPELLSDDGCALDDLALLRKELIEPRGEQRVDARRDRDPIEVARDGPLAVRLLQHPVVEEHADEFLDEQRVALGGRRDSLLEPRVELRGTEQVRQHRVHLLDRERFERERMGVGAPVGPPRPLLEQLRPREAEDHQRRPVAPADEVLDEIEQRRLRPVNVLEHKDERPRAREILEEAAERPERLLRARARAETEHACRALADERRALALGHECVEPLASWELRFGGKDLRLMLTGGNNTKSSDHGDWANAQLTCPNNGPQSIEAESNGNRARSSTESDSYSATIRSSV